MNKKLYSCLFAVATFLSPNSFASLTPAYDKVEFTQSELESVSTLAVQGNKDAQYQFGLLYMDKEPTDNNLSQALYWFQLAAEQGHTKAMQNLGKMYLNAVGVKKDIKKSHDWLSRAAFESTEDYNAAVEIAYLDSGVKYF